MTLRRYIGQATPPERETYAYKGYSIRKSPFRAIWTISKDGAHIATVTSIQAARDTIDTLT